MSIEIRPVSDSRDFHAFVDLPVCIYRDNPVWVRPLRREEIKKFRIAGNPTLKHCDYALFLALRDGKPAGRIAAFVDHAAVAHWGASIGLFGSYECGDNPEISSLLLDTARAWLRGRGMSRMRGPWSFNAEEWGLVVRGGDRAPMVLAPYNPGYYPAQMDRFGLHKVKDLYVYGLTLDSGYALPERFLKLTGEIERRTGVRVRPVRMNRLGEDVRSLVRVANESTRANWGHVPVTDAEADDLAKSLKPVIDPGLIMLAEKDGRPVGYQITLPDVNVILKKLNGRLLPFGIFHLLFGLRRIRQYRIWAMGIVPEFQRRAVDTLFYREMYETLRDRMPVKLEANWVLEDNMAMNNPILKLGFEHVKTYRVYEAEI